MICRNGKCVILIRNKFDCVNFFSMWFIWQLAKSQLNILVRGISGVFWSKKHTVSVLELTPNKQDNCDES